MATAEPAAGPNPPSTAIPPADGCSGVPDVEGRGAAAGLTSAEARERLARHGRNVIAEGRSRSVLMQLAARFANPLLLLLLGAATISGVTGDLRSAIVIIVMVLVSVLLDFVQEHRAGRAAEQLRQAAVVHATALRDGVPCEVPSPEIVPDDVVLLSAGDLVPADGRLLEARDLFVNQSMLTGEAFPVEKSVATGEAAPPAEARDRVLMGSSVVSGTARALIVETGARTALGQIGASLRHERPTSSFEQGARSFGMLILRLALVMILFVILVNILRGRPGLQSFLFAVALAVGLAPEMLPMVVSVTLSRGALRMARRKVLVKRLAAIHDLGSMDVLCTDKTGTLTEARIHLERHLDASGADSDRVLELAQLNSHFQSGLRSPLDDAIVQSLALDLSAWRKLDEIPFDFQRRCLSVLVQRGQAPPLLIVKGAFEDILHRSVSYEIDATRIGPLDDGRRAELLGRFEALGRDGFRVLGVAIRTLPADSTVTAAHEQGLVFAGFLVFQDPPKASARAALASLATLGVSIKVVTGDDERVATHVARQLALPVAGVLTGAELAVLDDAALSARAETTTLFCRVTPAQKNRVLLALKRRRHVVGFLGDGINDAAALHTADVGITVDSAVDVAKAAADLILLEQDLGVLRDGVIEGRRTLGNIIKYILMGTSSNFGNMFSMAGAALFLPFLPMLPLQILVNNFLYDLSELPIPTDTVEDELIRRPRRWDMSFIRKFMMVIGPVSSFFDFLTFWVLWKGLHASAPLFHTGWFVESLATQVLVIFVIRTRGRPWRSRPSAALTLTSLLVVTTAVLLPLSPLATTLGFVAPPGAFYLVLAGLVSLYLVAVELVKRVFYARLAPG